MPFLPATDRDRSAMLERAGAASVEELFSDLPESARFPVLDLPPPLSEMEVLREIGAMAVRNACASSAAWFLGAGAYYHFIPAVVPAIASRGEFLTAYTPYQPEVSQGTLQAIYEYQSMAAALLGVEVVNASHYDGATALAEAVLMARAAAAPAGVPAAPAGVPAAPAGVPAGPAGAAAGAAPKGARDRLVLSADLHPEYKAVIRTYLTAFPVRIDEVDGPPEAAAAAADASTFCVAVPYPGFSGALGDIESAAHRAHAAGALLAVHADPIMCGLLKSPGELGADIVAAEGQCLGNPMSFGGPFLGMLGTSARLVRRMPGRLAGEARDALGRRGFVLTLTAREQHIRREKAVSNICSNQGLAMLRACVYLAAMGPAGLGEAARLCWDKAHYAASRIASIPGFAVAPGEFFKEFTVATPAPAEELSRKLASRGVVPGLPVSRYYPGRDRELLVCVTEMCTRAQIDLLADRLAEAAR
jgi:glycine dehydrogenase subunit 1